MPYAVIAEWSAGGHDTSNYDEITRRMDVDRDPPAGLIVHSAGTTPEGGFRICDVWETREAYEAFDAERLRPMADSVLSALPPERQPAQRAPQVSVYELHNLLVPAPAAAAR
jgi:hypothetical protein